MGRDKPSARTAVFRQTSKVFPFLVQQPGTGALPALYAATSPDARGGAFYGPDGFAHLTGGPSEQRLYRAAEDRDSASRIWAGANGWPGSASRRSPRRAEIEASTATLDQWIETIIAPFPAAARLDEIPNTGPVAPRSSQLWHAVAGLPPPGHRRVPAQGHEGLENQETSATAEVPFIAGASQSI
jgi:hypothetical protein